MTHLTTNQQATKPNKKRCKSSFSPSTTNVSPSIASRRRTRRRTKTKVEGSNNDNAITIDDSSSDESSVGVNVDVLSINNEDVFLSQVGVPSALFTSFRYFII